ncbi:MAG: SIR2 family protein [Bacillota bacterium]
MSIDPTATLAVNIAAVPKTFAFFLGAGISRAAGIPSGSDILLDTCRRYYKACNKQEPQEGLNLIDWVQQTLSPGRVSYSTILGKVFMKPELRQEYLRAFFEDPGKEPTEAHCALARLAKAGYIKVFVTTNFDHLLEKALTELDVSWTRVSSAHELKATRPREHSQVYMLKVHGDYEYSDIRNTPSELEKLNPAMAADLRQILQSYGLVVVGYAGDDRGVRKVLTSKQARYGVYWLLHSKPTTDQDDLLLTLDARRMSGEADSFCLDLEARIQALATQPDGRTPRDQRNEVIRLLRAKDQVGIHVRAHDLSRRLVKDVLSFSEKYSHKPWAAEPTGDLDDTKAWEPFLLPVFQEIGPTVDAFCSAAIATGEAAMVTGEFEPDLLGPFLKDLQGLFGKDLPQSWESHARIVPSFVAMLVGNTLLTGALIADAWKMFVQVALLRDLKEGMPWTLTEQFHYSSMCGGYADRTGRAIMRWLTHSEALTEIRPFDSGPEPFAIMANILLSVAYRTGFPDGSDRYWWGYGFSTSLVDPLVRQLAVDDQMTAQLAPLVKGTPESLREQFYNTYLSEVRRERYSRFMPHGLTQDTLKLLQPSQNG